MRRCEVDLVRACQSTRTQDGRARFLAPQPAASVYMKSHGDACLECPILDKLALGSLDSSKPR